MPPPERPRLPSSVLTFAEQLSSSKPLPPLLPPLPPPPPGVVETDNNQPTVGEPTTPAVATMKKNGPNPRRPDSELGDLNCRFDPRLCGIPTDEEVAKVFSRVVVEHEHEDLVLCCGSAEFYVMNDLRSHRHSFENGSAMPDPMTTPKPCKYFPQGHDSFSNDVSVVRPNNWYGIFNDCFAGVQVCLPTIIKFVLQNGKIDQLRDLDSNTKNPTQRR